MEKPSNSSPLRNPSRRSWTTDAMKMYALVVVAGVICALYQGFQSTQVFAVLRAETRLDVPVERTDGALPNASSALDSVDKSASGITVRIGTTADSKTTQEELPVKPAAIIFNDKAVIAVTTPTLSFAELLEQAQTENSMVYRITGSGMNSFLNSWIRGVNPLCINLYEDWRNESTQIAATSNSTTDDTKPKPRLTFVDMDCYKLFRSPAGTGNFVTVLYGARLTAQVLGRVNVAMRCSYPPGEERNLITPWVMGWFPYAHQEKENQVQSTAASAHPTIIPLNATHVCETNNDIRKIQIGYLFQEIRFDLRRMAIALVGIPSPDHPSATWARTHLGTSASSTSVSTTRYMIPVDPTQPPLYPNITLDEAVIHFRCGDLINGGHSSFGFLKFRTFAKHLDPNVQSIGIITQPFSTGGQQRRGDTRGGRGDRCRILITAFSDYLKERFVKARITVHNGPDETIALAYARLVMAKQAVSGVSTFAVFPTIATFGIGYVYAPAFALCVNQWVIQPRLDEIAVPKGQIVLLDEEHYLLSPAVHLLWDNEKEGGKVIDWFRQDDLFIDPSGIDHKKD
jgi:hypothetical protein